MADTSDITFSGIRVRVTHDNGSYTVGTVPNSNQPEAAIDETVLGSFSVEGASDTKAFFVSKINEALDGGGVGNAGMLSVRLADKFIREHPGLIPE